MGCGRDLRVPKKAEKERTFLLRVGLQWVRAVCRSGAFCAGARGSRSLALIQPLANQGLDDRLPAHVEIFGGALELIQHGGRKIHVDALDGLSHFTKIGEKARNILAVVRHPSDGFGRDWLLLTPYVLHKVFAPR